ncbi:E3 ubiquitin-protein ligase RNF146-B-like [Polyodon spathula]|uniref:E3 ubiquitin-protein ligase RNF146-B-like n=1 Tax=Polyodon spathula TaxID=7913 RepID=UPI001B7EAC07|nr:E3 ubiquitin-protein ligase RNF146-B-like [Polyodon spathula]
MAGCGEINHTVNMLPTNLKVNEACSSTTPALTVPECAICLQTCVHPVRLPCRHIFCYLCVKGASWQSKRCALCRQEIPEDFLDKPTLLSPEDLKAAGRGNGENAWYYEGRNGWWQYDERTSRELEDAFSKGKKTTEMLIAGFLYVADLENMVQYRRNEHGRRRKIKRDIVDIPKKGVAGLRLDTDSNSVTVARENSADGADTTAVRGAAATSTRVATSARPPTSLGGQLTSPSTPSPDASSSLENSLAQLQIGNQSATDRGRNGEGEEVEDEGARSRGSSAPNTSVDESWSEISSEVEEEEGEVEQEQEQEQEEEEEVEVGVDVDEGEVTSDQAQYVLHTRQRLLHHDRPRESHADRPYLGGEPGSSSVRSRRPDGQCTVTDV